MEGRGRDRSRDRGRDRSRDRSRDRNWQHSRDRDRRSREPRHNDRRSRSRDGREGSRGPPKRARHEELPRPAGPAKVALPGGVVVPESAMPEALKELRALPEKMKASSPTMIRKVKAAKIRAERQQNVDRDHFERLSYLHQLSLLSLQIHQPLARIYVSEMKRVSRRTVIRMSKAVRNSYCRKCLKPSLLTKKHRFRTGRRHSFLMARCVHCGFIKRFLIHPRGRR